MKPVIAIFLLIAVPAASAAEPTSIVSGADVVSMIVSTLIVIAAIVGVGWLYSRSKFAVTGSRDVISIVSSKALGTKERLLLVEVADQQLLVGMTASQIQTLHIFDKPVVASEASTPAPASFADRLRASISEARR